MPWNKGTVAIRHFTQLSILLAICGPISPVGSQSPADRDILAEANRATAEPDSTASRAVDPMAEEIRLGLVELIGYERSGDRNVAAGALFRFNRAALARSDWVWPHYALARGFILLHDKGARHAAFRGGQLGESYSESALKHLRQALQISPEFLPAREMYGELLLASGDRTLRQEDRELLEDQMAVDGTTASELLVWSRQLRTRGAWNVALAVLGQAAVLGADRSVVALDRARILAANGKFEEAVASYWEGAEEPTSSGWESYRQDIAWLADSVGLAVLDSLPNSEMTAWLRRFWDQLDGPTLGLLGGRLRAHLAQWAVAHRRFRADEPWNRRKQHPQLISSQYYFGDGCNGDYYDAPVGFLRRPPPLPGDLREDEPTLDHRGLTYLRLGRPMVIATREETSDLEPVRPGAKSLAVVHRVLESVNATELWVYPVEGGFRVLIFRGSSSADSLGRDSLAHLSPFQAGPVWVTLGRTLTDYFPVRGGGRPSPAGICRADLNFSLTWESPAEPSEPGPDGSPPPLQRSWDAVYRYFAWGSGEDSTSMALITFAIKLADLSPTALQTGNGPIPIRTQISAYRPADGARAAIDSVRWFALRTPDRNGYLTGTFEVPLEPGEWELAVRTSQPGASPYVGSTSSALGIWIDDGTGLSLSDAVTGATGFPLWNAGEHPMPINTLGEWPEGTQIGLRYQIHGVTPDLEFTTRIELISPDNWPESSSRVEATTLPSESTLTVTKIIETEGLEPGPYWLAVKVTQGEESVERFQEILILQR